MPRSLARQIRTVLRWQMFATAALAVLCATLGGPHGAASAVLGGLVSVCAGWASAATASRRETRSAADTLVAALVAEGVKFGLILLLLALVLVLYKAVVVEALLGVFVLTMLIFSMAIFVRDRE